MELRLYLVLLLVFFFLLVPIDSDPFFFVRREGDKALISFISGKRGITCLISLLCEATIRVLCSSTAAARVAIIVIGGSESYEYPRK